MGAIQKYVITVECDTPLQVMLGENIGGGIVKELKALDNELLSASQLAEKYNMSTDTVRRRLKGHNQGTSGKYLYNAKIANSILNQKSKRGTSGARRKN